MFRRPTMSCFLLFFSFRRPTMSENWVILRFVARRRAVFFHFSIKKMRFFCSRRLFLSKNCNFSAPNGCFYQKIAIFLLLTAISVKKLRFFCSRRLFLQKPWTVLLPDAHFCKKRWQVLLPDWKDKYFERTHHHALYNGFRWIARRSTRIGSASLF